MKDCKTVKSVEEELNKVNSFVSFYIQSELSEIGEPGQSVLFVNRRFLGKRGVDRCFRQSYDKKVCIV